MKQCGRDVHAGEQHDREGAEHVPEQHALCRLLIGRRHGRQREAEHVERREQRYPDVAADRHDDQQQIQHPVCRMRDALLPRRERRLVRGRALREPVDQPRDHGEQDDQPEHLVRAVEEVGDGVPDIEALAAIDHHKADRDLHGEKRHRPPVKAPRRNTVWPGWLRWLHDRHPVAFRPAKLDQARQPFMPAENMSRTCASGPLMLNRAAPAHRRSTVT